MSKNKHGLSMAKLDLRKKDAQARFSLKNAKNDLKHVKNKHG